jgi:carboxypeptidase family protein
MSDGGALRSWGITYMFVSRRSSFLAVGFLLFALGVLWASITGSISGIVTDQSGAVISGATVTATNPQTEITTTLQTDAKGYYSFTALPVGTYNIDVHQSGFKAYRKNPGNVWGRRLIGGWELSGITTFAPGLPITLSETGARGVDIPVLVGTGKGLNDTNPRHGQPYFNTSLFAKEAIGQIGNTNRRFFHGPGIYNFDRALLKAFKFTESKELQVRFEAFNVFNHAQFKNPNRQHSEQYVWVGSQHS